MLIPYLQWRTTLILLIIYFGEKMYKNQKNFFVGLHSVFALFSLFQINVNTIRNFSLKHEWGLKC